MINIYAAAFNEELLVGLFIDFYRYRFPGCKITIYDNQSTDRTKEIAESKGCTVISYSTDNKMSERALIDIKNNCWKGADVNWVLIVDIDELVDIGWYDLLLEQRVGTTMIDFEYWTVVNKKGTTKIRDMNYGVHHKGLTSKRCLFNPRAIHEINFEIGAHKAHPVGYVRMSEKKYKFLHYKMLSFEWILARYRLFKTRLDDEAIKNGWGLQYRFSKFRIWWSWITLCVRAKRIK